MKKQKKKNETEKCPAYTEEMGNKGRELLAGGGGGGWAQNGVTQLSVTASGNTAKGESPSVQTINKALRVTVALVCVLG